MSNVYESEDFVVDVAKLIVAAEDSNKSTVNVNDLAQLFVDHFGIKVTTHD